ncbi:MAG: VOC family protein [Acidobacteriota bacterium]
MTQTMKPGTIGWCDLTVDDADTVRDFYRDVVGWSIEPTPMGEYNDYTMTRSGDGEAIAGVCHARGSNAGLPPRWLIYVVVEDLAASISAAQERGGELIHGPRGAGGGSIAVLRDPAGAEFALYQA